jgi:MFS family permease
MGQLCDRFGVVVAIMLGTLAVGIGYAGAALVPGPLTFALMHLFIGVGASATFGPLMADMAQWFVRHRGIAVGLAATNGPRLDQGSGQDGLATSPSSRQR